MSSLKSLSVARRSMLPFPLRAAGEQEVTQVVRLLALGLLDLPANLLSFLLKLLQVGVHFLPVPQVVGDHRIGVGKVQAGVHVVGDLVRRRAELVGADDEVKPYARAADADRAVL